MAGNAEELAIRSRYGMFRDLVPIYSLHQLLPNLIVLGFILWLTGVPSHLAPPLIVLLLFGWLYQYESRPSAMHVSTAQAAWLEELLDEQKFYARSEADGRWRTTDHQWWKRWPHQFIEFAPDIGGVTVIAPHGVIESIRAGFELLEEHGEISFASDDEPFAFQQPEPEALPWHVHVPTVLLGAICIFVSVWTLFNGTTNDWGVSGLAISQGRFGTIFLHMFAHAGLMHLVMNMSALVAIGGALVARLGSPPSSWLRFLALFLLSGLSGAALYLALHPAGTVPMVGASGALYGLVGLLIRAPADGGTLVSVRSSRIRRIGWDLIKQNAFLFALLALMSWSSGHAGGLAWEAHLGGFLFGLFVGPRFLPRVVKPESSASPAFASAG